MIGKGTVGIKAPKVRNFIKKIAVFASIFLLPSATLCTDHAEIRHETVAYTAGILSRLSPISDLSVQMPPNFHFGSDLEVLPPVSRPNEN